MVADLDLQGTMAGVEMKLSVMTMLQQLRQLAVPSVLSPSAVADTFSRVCVCKHDRLQRQVLGHRLVNARHTDGDAP